MSNSIILEYAKARLEYLVAGTKRGEEWLITDAEGQLVAKLSSSGQTSTPTNERRAAFGMMKGQIEIAPDFDEPLEDFKEYME